MIYIRVDMNAKIATGHVMRCLSVADAIRERGETVTFILADSQAVPFIRDRGYESMVLDTDWEDMDSEIPKLLEVIEKQKITRMLVDSYQVTPEYLGEIATHTKVMYLDDLGLFDYPVASVVCYANYWKRFYGKAHTDSRKKYFLGTQYVPLRRVFWSNEPKTIPGRIRQLLLLSGGTDPYNFLGTLLGLLDLSEFARIDVVCGRYHEHYEELCHSYGDSSCVVIHQMISDMETYMRRADLAVSAGGTTLYELCACGTPAISYSFVDNQLGNVRQFDSDGLIDYAGDLRSDDVARNVKELIKKYQDDPRIRKQRSAGMQELVDGRGALRLAEAVCDL